MEYYQEQCEHDNEPSFATKAVIGTAAVSKTFRRLLFIVSATPVFLFILTYYMDLPRPLLAIAVFGFGPGVLGLFMWVVSLFYAMLFYFAKSGLRS